MKANDVNNVKALFRELIHKAIINSVEVVVKKSNNLHTKPQEPDFIASLVLFFTPGLYQTLKLLFPNNRFSITGIFCHQKPIVNIKASKNPELGDLLIIYIYTDEKGFKQHNSILLQAKISSNIVSTVSASDEHQLKLYTKWPAFSYLRAGRLNGQVRDIQPKTLNDGAQYLLIDTHPLYGLAGLEGTYPMGCATPAKILHINNDLAAELVDFFKFKSGRTFEENYDASNDDWTKMIWEMLDISKDNANRRNIGLEGFPRQVTDDFDGSCFFVTDGSSYFNDLHRRLGDGRNDRIKENNFNENNFSPSIILIENSSQIQEPNNPENYE